jgi:acyl-CoA hydrolase
MKDAEAISHFFSILSMDTIHFIAPVEVGDIVKFSSTISYVDVKKGLVRTKVKCSTYSADKAKEKTSNVMNFTLKVDTSKIKLLPMMP